MDIRNEVVFNDLAAQCLPADHISAEPELFRWNRVTYRTNEFSGTMLAAIADAHPQDVTLDPGLTGWYRIFVAQPALWSSGARSCVCLKLTGDGAFQHFSHTGQTGFASSHIQETFWRCADMTGRSVVIGKEPYGKPMDAAVSWFRFVPMSDEEVAAFRADQARTDTKRIYATNDMHGMLCMHGFQTREAWRSVVEEYDQSDVEWLAIEDVSIFDGEPSTGDSRSFAFPRSVDERAQRLLKREFTDEMLSDVIAYGHEKGLKMCLSIRMGGWGMDYPFDNMYFINTFFQKHKQLRCADHDGQLIDALSYAYPEVQDFIISHLVNGARMGADAVELIGIRGIPYVLCEQPVADLFFQRYGEDIHPLPLEDERVMAVHCEIMTGFFRRLRAALDEATGKNKTRIHLHALYSLYDNRYVGFDLEELARQGLVDAIISYPQKMHENLDADIWQDEGRTHLDLAKYTAYANAAAKPIMDHPTTNFNTMDPLPDSHGVPHGPVGQQAHVDELMALEKQYGVQLYFEILPRVIPADQLLERARELYACGVERFCMWDTYSRAFFRIYWTMARRLGHKEELAGWTSGEGEMFRRVRVLEYNGVNISRYLPSWGG